MTRRRDAGLLVVTLVALCVLVLLAQPVWLTRVFPGLAPRVDVLLAERHYRVTPEVAREIQGVSARHLAEGARDVEAMLEARVGAALDEMFAELAGRVPAYADWYYSLAGEYARLGGLLLSGVGMNKTNPAVAQASKIVFGGEAFERELVALTETLDLEVRDRLVAARAAWLESVLPLLERGRTVVTRFDEAGVPPEHVVALDAFAQAIGASDPVFLARASVSGGAGVSAVAAPLVARMLTRPMTAAGGRAMAARGAARGASKLGSGAGAAGCALGGPAAVPCALVVGGATWFATDWLLLSADEWLHREAFIAQWHADLDALRDELEQALLAPYRSGIDAWGGEVRRTLQRDFSPLQSIRGG